MDSEMRTAGSVGSRKPTFRLTLVFKGRNLLGYLKKTRTLKLYMPKASYSRSKES